MPSIYVPCSILPLWQARQLWTPCLQAHLPRMVLTQFSPWTAATKPERSNILQANQHMHDPRIKPPINLSTTHGMA